MTPKEQEELFGEVRKKFPAWSFKKSSGYIHGIVDGSQGASPDLTYCQGMQCSPHYAMGYVYGYLVENCVQAMSRDILAEAVLNLESKLGVRVPLTVHDDMSVVLPLDDVDRLVPLVEECVRQAPVWAPGLPVDIEYQLSERYMKI